METEAAEWNTQGKKREMLGYGFHLIPDTKIEVTTDYDYLRMEDRKDSEKSIYRTAQAGPMSLRTRSCTSEAEHQMGQENQTGDWMSYIQRLTISWCLDSLSSENHTTPFGDTKGAMVKSTGPGATTWVQILALPLTICVILSVKLSGPWFLHLKDRDGESACPMGI